MANFSPGDRVMAQGGWVCGNCESCPAGRTSSCSSRVLLGRNAPGCFAAAVAVPAEVVHCLPESVDTLSAQSATTVATAIHAAERAGDLLDRKVAILGPGHAGLILLQVCRARGAADVTVFGTRVSRP